MTAFDLKDLLRTTRDTRGNPTGTWRYFRPVLTDREPPCAAVCPAGNNIRKFVRLAAEKEYHAALAAIKKENPLPAVCGRVCHHPCMGNCSRNDVDAPLAVNQIERGLGDLVQEFSACLPEPAATSGKTVAVVGSGPAGLSCAYHAALLGHNVTIFDAAKRPGGMLRAGIPAYRLPRAALDADLSFIDALKIELKLEHNISSLDELKQYDAVCMAPGAHQSRKLNIPGMDAAGVCSGLGFLEKVNAGDMPDVGRRAVVIGGGNTAMDCARAALRLGASVTVLYRRGADDMPALPDEIAEAAEEGVAFIHHAAPSEILAANNQITSLKCIRTSPGEPDPDGRCRPVPVPDSEFELPADIVICAVGETPRTDWMPGDMLAHGDVLNIDPVTLKVACGERDGVFCAGDAASGATRTVSHAIGAGKRAALAMDIFLKGELDRAGEILASVSMGHSGALSSRKYRAGDFGPPPQSAPREQINTANIEHTTPQTKHHLAVTERILTFDEVNTDWTNTETSAEAARCMNCGSCTSCGVCLLFCPDISVLQGGGDHPDFNQEFCKGCGICVRECPRAAIDMIEEEK